MEYQAKHSNAQRAFREAVLNGELPSAIVVAQLEAIGIDVAELEQRIRQQIEWRH
jgi:hypothetical protein